jgi:hypothetical protein
MTNRDDQNAQSYESPDTREPVGAGVRRTPARRLGHHLPVRFPDEMINIVRKLADEDGLTVSAWIRRAVADEVERRSRAASSTQPSPGAIDLMEALRFAVQQRDSVTETQETAEGSSQDRNLTQLAG